MKEGELNFFKATVLSKSKEDIFMCSDMPMIDMAEDIEFSKKWMFAIAMSLKKGLHLNIIHNLDREKSNLLLKKANPLMNIYKEENKIDYYSFLEQDEKIICDRKRTY